MNFGHHDDPAVDFVTEVEMIESEITDRAAGLPATFDLGARIARAMQFKVGGDPAAVVAKSDLRKIELAYKAGSRCDAPAVPQLVKKAEGVCLYLGNAYDGEPRRIIESLCAALRAQQPTAGDGPNQLQVGEAIHAAAAAIYFTDSSDYLKALWAVLRKLAPGVAEVLEKNPRGVFDDEMNLLPGLAAAGERGLPEEFSLMSLVDRVARKWDGHMRDDAVSGGDFDIGQAVREEFAKALAGRDRRLGDLPVTHLRSITHPDWLEVCDKESVGAFPVYAAGMPQLRMPGEADLLQAQIQSGADDLDRCHQAIRTFCVVNGLKLEIDGEEEQGDSYDAIWNALQRIETVAAFLPTLEIRHEGGIEAVAKNIVEAIAAAGEKLEKLEEAQKRERILVQALKGMADEFVKLYPIYYYAEPWAHDRNLALRFAHAVLADVGAAVGPVPEKAQIAACLRGVGLTPQAAETVAGELIHYFAKGEWLPVVNEADKA